MLSIKKIAVGAVLLTSASIVLSARVPAASEENRSAVLATIGSHKITEQQVDGRVRDQLNTLQAQIYQLKEHAVEAIAADELIEQAAANAHLSVDAYIKREVDDKIPDPPEAEVRKVYEAFKRQLTRPYDQERPALIAYLKERDKPNYRQDLIGRLRSQLGVKILLKAPRLYVSTAGHPAEGAKDAPVTLVEFGDFDCPFTRKAEDTVKQIRAKYGSKLRLVYVDHPLPVHPYAFLADTAARCADAQGKFWQYHDALLADQAKPAPDELKAVAAKVGLDTKKFADCFAGGKTNASLRADQKEADELRIEGTPTFFVNGRVIFGAASLQDFERLIDEELASANGRVARAGD